MASFTTSDDEEIPKWKLAREGIRLIINNRAQEAEILFKKYPESIQMHAGYSFAVFMDALMTFEEDKLATAFAALKETERRCASDAGWLKTVKSKVFGSETSLSLAEQLENQIILADSQVCMAILIFLQQDISGYFKGGWILRKSWKIYQNAYGEIRSLYKQIVGELPDAVTYQHQLSSGSALSIPQEEDVDGILTGPESTCEWEFPNDPVPSIPPPSNGYIHPYSSKTIPHSYTTHFDEKTKVINTNGPVWPNKPNNNNKKCNCVSNNNFCNNTNCDGSSNGFFPRHFLKKSTSVNSALSRSSEKPGGLFSHFTPFSSTLSLSYFSSNFNMFSDNHRMPNVDKSTITRLMGAVSFGYGLFHLGISLLPPSLLRLTSILGFGGNRQIGVRSLMYARQGVDMRAPLATLSLLWYHTIVRPFYALDGSNVQAGVEAASQLIQESQQDYSESALFLFFRGRVELLKSDIPSALSSFQSSVDNSVQREIKILALHEVGWCHLIQLDYTSAESTFQILRSTSRWSRCFYTYLELICSGSCNSLQDQARFKDVRNLAENVPKCSQLEVFLVRRIKLFPDTFDAIRNSNAKFWKLFVYEMLYLWNTLPSCGAENIRKILEDCELPQQEPMVGLAKLIQGSCYFILKQFEEGVRCLRTCLEMRKTKVNNSDDAHVSAFAQYELGNFLVKHDETKEEGKNLLMDVSHYKDYDFESRLTVRIHTILKHS